MGELTFVLNDSNNEYYDIVIDGVKVGEFSFNKAKFLALIQLDNDNEDGKNITDLIRVLSSYIAQANILLLEMDSLLLRIINLGNGCNDREATYMRDKIHKLLGNSGQWKTEKK